MRSASAMALRHLAKPLPRGLSEVLWSPRSVPEMNARASTRHLHTLSTCARTLIGMRMQLRQVH